MLVLTKYQIPNLEFEKYNYYFINLLDNYKYIKYKKKPNNKEYDIYIYDKNNSTGNSLHDLTNKFFYKLDIFKRSYTIPYLFYENEHYIKKCDNSSLINYLFNFL